MYGKRSTPSHFIEIRYCNYNLSEYLVTLLSNLTRNDNSVKDSFDFAREMGSYPNDNYVMTNFDVISLFTNIPVQETTEIILKHFFLTDNVLYNGYDKKTFRLMYQR